MPNTETATREVEAIKKAWRGLRWAIVDVELCDADSFIHANATGRMEAYLNILHILTGRERADIVATALRTAKERGLLDG